MLKTFAKKNKQLCLEICSLNELGYHLEPNQRDLTFIQKLFLMEAYPIFNQAREDTNKEPESSNDTGFNARYKAKLEENKRKHKKRLGGEI